MNRWTALSSESHQSLPSHIIAMTIKPAAIMTPRLRRLKTPSLQHPVYDHALRHERILDIVAQLIGPAIRYNGEKLNIKSAAFGSPVQWHQDWAFYPHTNDDLLAVGVALDDMSLENGALMVIPGSQKGPIYDHHQNGMFVGAVTDRRFRAEGAVAVEVKAGPAASRSTMSACCTGRPLTPAAGRGDF